MMYPTNVKNSISNNLYFDLRKNDKRCSSEYAYFPISKLIIFCHFCVARNIKYLKLIFYTFTICYNQAFPEFLEVHKYDFFIFFKWREHWSSGAKNLRSIIIGMGAAPSSWFESTSLQIALEVLILPRSCTSEAAFRSKRLRNTVPSVCASNTK